MTEILGHRILVPSVLLNCPISLQGMCVDSLSQLQRIRVSFVLHPYLIYCQSFCLCDFVCLSICIPMIMSSD